MEEHLSATLALGNGKGHGRLMAIHPSLELASLIEGYRRFHGTEWSERRERWAALREGQEPRVMVIACADSRTDPAMVFDADPGEIFVVRNIAAMVPPFETNPGLHGVSAALEFAMQALQVREIVIMGHGMCGGCKAAPTQEMNGAERGHGGFIADWISMLDEAREPIAARLGTTGRDAEQAMEHAAVKVSLANLRTFPNVRELEAEGKLRLRGAFFAISEGVLYLLDEETGEFVAA
jgi:carbonic anhydrase